MSKAEILKQALELPEADREELANHLLDSLNGADPELDQDLAEELERRAAAYERGELKAEDAFEAIEKARRSLGRGSRS